ncbi:hypothetical protein EMIT0111MI5_20468 [Burkholderia sp. IT-111MI5]
MPSPGRLPAGLTIRHPAFAAWRTTRFEHRERIRIDLAAMVADRPANEVPPADRDGSSLLRNTSEATLKRRDERGASSLFNGARTIGHGEQPDRIQRGTQSDAQESVMGHPMIRCYAVPQFCIAKFRVNSCRRSVPSYCCEV